MKIENYLIKKGIKVANKGFDCLMVAIRLMQKDITYKNFITKRLYPDVAAILGETPNKVERSMRHELIRSKIGLTVSEFVTRAALELSVKR